MTLMAILILTLPLSHQNVIDTAQGKLRGFVHDGYVSYSGIPYASAPSTEGRFKAAGLAPTWHGVRESKEPNCLTSMSSNVEECLQLDVHVPSRHSKNWPVLVWITGGGTGYNPKHLVQQGIILVIVYHRIGPLGFLCLGDDKVPGNAGMKDVILALRWIRDNIAALKGNPAKVNIAGQGFGAAIAEGLMLSPMSRGLYHGVILQSGSILCPWAFNYDSKERSKSFAAMFKGNNITKVKNYELVAHVDKLNATYFPFGICIDGNIKKEERFLYEAPYNLLVNKEVNHVPMIIGFTTEEGYIFASTLKENIIYRAKALEAIEALVPKELIFVNSREFNSATKMIKDVYFNKTNMSALIKFHTDAYFINHIHRSIRLHASSSHYPVYVYQFSYVGEVGVQAEADVVKTSAAHSDELAYIFGSDLEGDDGAVQRNMIKLWANFVKYLNPTPKADPLHWEPVNTEDLRLLDISSDLKMIEFLDKKAMKMWDEFYEKFYYTRNSRSRN